VAATDLQSPPPIDSAAPLTVTTEIAARVDIAPTDSFSETAAATGVPLEEAGADPALVAAGREVYLKQYCGVCHSLTAAGTTGTFGPAHDGLGTTAAQRIVDEAYNGQATSPAEYIRESIVDPQAYIVPGYATTSHRMPAYSHLDGETLDALVAFLAAQ
jgi:mono/diheme cytochrome c family protein